MKTIRPYQLFSNPGLMNRDVRYSIPDIPSRDSLSVFALETLLLVAMARIAQAHSILEFGTSYGYTAMHLAMNTEASVTTVDIKENPHRVYYDTRWQNRIQTVTLDTAAFTPRPFDMVFIDGDHSYEAVKRDTEKAFACTPDVIAWHDYGNMDAPDVACFLDERMRLTTMFHVADSWLVFWVDPDAGMKF